jgi:hypothetical protein
LCFARNFAIVSGGSALHPRMVVPSFSNFVFASRNSDASVVQPGVSALTKKYSRMFFPRKSESETIFPSSLGSENAGATSPGCNINSPRISEYASG